MKIGDSVSVINDNLSGVITSVNGSVISIKDKDGFIHQFKKNEVVEYNKSLYDNMKMEIKNENSTPKLSKKHNKNHLILDLHFEKLVANSAQHDGFERLFLQKKKLLDTLDFCKENNLKKLEIIHGIGNGQLQELVIKTLEYQMDIDYQHTAILPHQSGSIMVFFK